MKITSKVFPILIITAILLICVQAARLDLLFRPVTGLTNELDYYDPTQAEKLEKTDELSYFRPHFLLLYNSNQLTQLDNISDLLNNLHIQFESRQVLEKSDNYKGFDVVILLDSVFDKIVDWPKIQSFVEAGGKLIYLCNGTANGSNLIEKASELFGISWIGKNDETDAINLQTELISGITGKLSLAEDKTSAKHFFKEIELNLVDSCIIHMTDENGNPMIWEHNVGNGKILVLTLGHYEAKFMRGILTGAISVVSDLLIYPIIDSTVIFIDDFPADYHSTYDVIASNYGRNFQRYVLEIWWPDMKSLMEKYHLKYTAAFIETYNNQVSGPFEDNTGITDTMQQIVMDVLNYQGEIAFHGYNHQPLFLNQTVSNSYGYKAWPNATSIQSAVISCTEFFNKKFPNYKFYTYVPPSNLMDSKMIPILKQALPDLRTISGIYYPDIEESGKNNQDFCIQDYTVDSFDLAYLPRVTSGAFLSNLDMFLTASVVTSNGIVNHFVHPDDILDPGRSKGLLWEDMAKAYDNIFFYLTSHYGWLKNEKASVAAETLRKIAHADLYYNQRSNAIEINCNYFTDGIPLIIVCKDKLLSGNGYELTKVDSLRYLVILHQDTVIVGVQSK